MTATNSSSQVRKYQLAKLITGELSPEETEALGLAISKDEAAQTYLRQVQAASSELPALNTASLRARAQALRVKPANNVRGFLFGAAALLLAATALFFVTPSPSPDPYTGVRGGGVLSVYMLEAGLLTPYNQQDLGDGDAVAFIVDPANHTSVVLLSIDGSGVLSVHYPAVGETPYALKGDGPEPLPGSIILDDASGYEAFIAVFDQDVADAREDAMNAYQSGLRGLQEWAQTSKNVQIEVVKKR